MGQKQPQEGISCIYTNDNIVHIQVARRLTKRDKVNHDKSKNFMVQEVVISFDPEAWLEEKPKILSRRTYYV